MNNKFDKLDPMKTMLLAVAKRHCEENDLPEFILSAVFGDAFRELLETEIEQMIKDGELDKATQHLTGAMMNISAIITNVVKARVTISEK